MNDTTKWIMIILLLLLIGAAVFMLLRSPGKDNGDDRAVTDVDRDRDGLADTDAAPVAPVETSRPDREVFDQAAVDQTPAGTYAEAPVAEPVYDEPVAETPVYDEPVAETTYDEPEFRDTPLPADDETTYAEPEFRDTPLPADDEPTYDEPVAEAPAYDEPEADRQERISRSAEIGALGAAGAAGVAGAAAGATAPTAEETGYAPDAGAHEPDTTYVDETSRPTVTEGAAEEVADVHPLTDQDIDAGASTEPLTADAVVEQADAADSAPEYPVGDDATYRVEAGEAVAVEEPLATPTDTEQTTASPTYTQDELLSAQEPATTTGFVESSFGAGSAEPLEDGTGPAGWQVKGNAGSMLFHTPDSPSYDAVRAEVWFESEDAARNAGFAHWDRRRR
ncbi:hypothetical protein [Ornithinimicrobium tianjinense]|uniref:Uncharacterized protein n=1 Tax=Ornithinimicrobium tianjinense TaxID=1195761 RepID=A0A917BCQ6_9MICO|nr:hypothetical protein [Ornithinimicrobium tianjinense]GGF36974.1 hypothetical protein GCM10011366_00720 [Ornithinimicrobium tianjinense]